MRAYDWVLGVLVSMVAMTLTVTGGNYWDWLETRRHLLETQTSLSDSVTIYGTIRQWRKDGKFRTNTSALQALDAELEAYQTLSYTVRKKLRSMDGAPLWHRFVGPGKALVHGVEYARAWARYIFDDTVDLCRRVRSDIPEPRPDCPTARALGQLTRVL